MAAGVRDRVIQLSITVLPVQEAIVKEKNSTAEELSLEVIPRLLEAWVTHVLVHDSTRVSRQEVLLENDAVEFITAIARDAIEEARHNKEDAEDCQEEPFAEICREYLEDGYKY